MSSKKPRLSKQETSKEIQRYHRDFDNFLKKLQLDYLTSVTRKEDKDA